MDIQILDEKMSQSRALPSIPNLSVKHTYQPASGYRDLAVKVVVNGQVAAGYRLENISVFPPVITVFAEES